MQPLYDHLLRLALILSFVLPVVAQTNEGGYIGYQLQRRGDQDSAVYETANTPSNASDYPPPDVFLNASVSVGEIDIEVDNLSAQVNLQAQVLQLLDFNAGVTASIDSVRLQIQNISAKVLLEARLENVVSMIDDVLSSIDLNPVIATLGEDVGDLVGNIGDGLTGGSGSGSGGSNGTNITARGVSSAEDYDITHNVLYSINDYSGNAHTNRILEQDGSIVDESLDNDGNITGQRIIGNYATDMTFTGHNITSTVNDVPGRELEYTYMPAPGISAICAIYTDVTGKVLKTQVISETRAGGGSTIGED